MEDKSGEVDEQSVNVQRTKKDCPQDRLISSKRNNLLPRILATIFSSGGRCTGGNGALSIPTHAQHMVLPVVQRQALLLAPRLTEQRKGDGGVYILVCGLREVLKFVSTRERKSPWLHYQVLLSSYCLCLPESDSARLHLPWVGRPSPE